MATSWPASSVRPAGRLRPAIPRAHVVPDDPHGAAPRPGFSSPPQRGERQRRDWRRTGARRGERGAGSGAARTQYRRQHLSHPGRRPEADGLARDQIHAYRRGSPPPHDLGRWLTAPPSAPPACLSCFAEAQPPEFKIRGQQQSRVLRSHDARVIDASSAGTATTGQNETTTRLASPSSSPPVPIAWATAGWPRLHVPDGDAGRNRCDPVARRNYGRCHRSQPAKGLVTRGLLFVPRVPCSLVRAGPAPRPARAATPPTGAGPTATAPALRTACSPHPRKPRRSCRAFSIVCAKRRAPGTVGASGRPYPSVPAPASHGRDRARSVAAAERGGRPSPSGPAP